MKPLNPTDVIWLSGSADEINHFLKSEEIRDHAIVLGHPDDAKRTLMAGSHMIQGLAWEVNVKPLLDRVLHGQTELEIAFLLLQGKVLGLVKESVKEVRE
jgi:hypothetical protein